MFDIKLPATPRSSRIRFFLCLALFHLCAGAPQYFGNYNYNSNTNNYPYRPLPYSQHPIYRYPTRAPAANYNAYRRANYNYNSNGYNSRNDLAATTVPTTKSPADVRREKYRASKADMNNAKFLGVNNQEADDESGRTVALLAQKRRLYRLNRCFGLGRDATTSGTAGRSTAATPVPKESGRFLWDLNIYNVYANSPVAPSYGCGGFGGGLGGLGLGGLGGGLGGGLLSDPIAPAYPGTPFTNFLGLFAPGILQNTLAATARPYPYRPQLQADPTGTGDSNELQSDPNVDPGYNQRPLPPIRRPNQVFFDTAGAPPITPAQLVGGVATTVNGIIQQLTGNVQPVYPG